MSNNIILSIEVYSINPVMIMTALNRVVNVKNLREFNVLYGCLIFLTRIMRLLIKHTQNVPTNNPADLPIVLNPFI